MFFVIPWLRRAETVLTTVTVIDSADLCDIV